uniref:NADP-dependent oxidoreductase domain-containing protein n=1 Tax=Acrobeloides nanus TaxID=290746 RepID=A0A914C1S1_9BILA
MPRIIYGTAWKKERTTDLVVKAVLAGFRGIDTACQPKHYQEDLVGNALEILKKQHGIERKDLFIQTKFTSLDGQDPTRIPYDKNAPLTEQVRQSLAKSLSNLKTDYIDSLVMHSPMRTHGDTMLVWKIFEEFHSQGKVKQLGISNIYDPRSLARIHDEAQVKPAVVQNRFYADSGYDKEIRDFCNKHNIVYQSFWTLTGNPHILRSPQVKQMAAQRSATPEQIFFRFVMDIGIAPLTGTTNDTHMKQDLAVLDMAPLAAEEIETILNMLN